jgi:hypothetical protein
VALPNLQRLRRVLLALSGGAGVLSLIIAASGGLALRVAGVPLRARTPAVAIAVAVASAVAAFLAGGPARVRDDLERAWNVRARVAPGVALTAALACAGVGLAWGTWAASGADACGYVSEALLWARGSLAHPVPLAGGAPWPSPELTLAPLGWKPAPEPGAIVPTYAPGLPLFMALGAALGGVSAVFWIVPVTGALAVWWTWRLGEALTDKVSAAAAAVLMACGPAFLFQIVQPMSDVPVTAWWTGALLFTLTRRPGLAGLCTAAAILTRPNLAPLGGWLAVLLWLEVGVPARPRGERRIRWRALAWFTAAATPGVALWLATNRRWYGAWLASGYGAFSDLFSTANVGTNATRYGSWLLHAHTPFVLLAFTSPFLLWWASRRPVRGATSEAARADDGPDDGVPRPGMMPAWGGALAWAILVVLAYLPYASFAEWTYLRFLLPALPVLLVLSCAVATALLARVPASLAVVVLVGGVAALGARQIEVARQGQAFDLQRLERRYVDAGRFAGRYLPSSSVLLAVQQSGSLAIYSGRPTLRWDNLDPAAFDRALAYLRGLGLTPFLVLEAWEEPQFRDHLSASSDIGRLDWPPAVELNLAVKVRFYDPRDRAEFVAGGPVVTKRYGPDDLRQQPR